MSSCSYLLPTTPYPLPLQRERLSRILDLPRLQILDQPPLLLRQLRGHVIVLWDGGSIHKGPDVRALLARCPRLHVEPFPGYAPDLNPDEFVWTHFKATLANGRPDTLDELMATLCRITKKARKRPELLRSFVTASELPPFW